MALINCPECNKEISDKAESCPHCACPIEKKLIPIIYTYNGLDYDISEILYYIKINDEKTAIKKMGEQINGIRLYVEGKKIYDEIKLTRKYREIPIDRIPFTPPDSSIKCPYCGSTNIQIVKRGWKITTGFLGSSKNERVCVNCMKKF